MDRGVCNRRSDHGKGDAEAETGIPPIGRIDGAAACAKSCWKEKPRSTSCDMVVAAVGPKRSSVVRSAQIVVVPAILRPLGGVADHVVESELIGEEGSDGREVRVPVVAGGIVVLIVRD